MGQTDFESLIACPLVSLVNVVIIGVMMLGYISQLYLTTLFRFSNIVFDAVLCTDGQFY
jgi:hypothetical protein